MVRRKIAKLTIAPTPNWSPEFFQYIFFFLNLIGFGLNGENLKCILFMKLLSILEKKDVEFIDNYTRVNFYIYVISGRFLVTSSGFLVTSGGLPVPFG